MIDTDKLRDVANSRGVENYYQLAKLLNVPDTSARRLWEATTDPKLSTVDRLCEVLGCQISEITSPPEKRAAPKTRSRRKAKRQ